MGTQYGVIYVYAIHYRYVIPLECEINYNLMELVISAETWGKEM